MPTASSSRSIQRRARVAPKSETQPALAIVTQESGRPTEHKGVKVKREELIGNLPKAPFRVSRLILVGGAKAFACRDCLFTGDSRGEVMDHRNKEHGANFGGKRKISDVPPLRSTPDPILPEREPGKNRPSEPMHWTLGELVALAPSLTALGDMLEDTQEKLIAVSTELAELRNETRDWKAKAEAYDELREEAQELRAFKRKMITRLKQMGFELSEEEEQ